MTQDDLKLAKKAHYILVTEVYKGHQGQLNPWELELMSIFAKLVAERERDKLFVMFMEAHEGAKHSHNYWHVAANKIKGKV